MQTFKFNRYETNLFDTQQANLVYDQERFLPFINRVFSKENIFAQAKQKVYSLNDRVILRNELLNQYQGLSLHDEVRNNIDSLLSEETFTITTGHQLSLFTGPMYFVIKILHIIKMCNELNNQDQEQKFVPVYWMASEDHDFEEIKKIHLFNRQITWESDQSGPVGRFLLDEGFNNAIIEIESLFGNDSQEIIRLLKSYKGQTYGNAFRAFINELFGKYGLVIIDGDSKEFKNQFKEVVKTELEHQFAHSCVDKTTAALKVNGGKIQINSREINLFYIENGIRERIELKDDGYYIEGLGKHSKQQLLELLDNKPECFSPNVVLRPVYQEILLPNVLYVGGGGEISYWIQLKGVFDYLKLTYPLIQVRNSVLWIDGNISEKIAKHGLLLEDVFKDEHLLKREYLEDQESEVLDFTEFNQRKDNLLMDLKDLVINVDAGLGQYAEAEITRINKQIDQIQSRLIRASKSKHESAMKSIELIKSRLFPGNGLQERFINFFNYCHKGDVRQKIELLYSAIEPFENDLIVIRDIPEAK